jgi:hypothetical protein
MTIDLVTPAVDAGSVWAETIEMAAQSPHLRLQGDHQPFPSCGAGTDEGEGKPLTAIGGEGQNQGLRCNAKKGQVGGDVQLKAKISLLLKMMFDIRSGLIDAGLRQEMGTHQEANVAAGDLGVVHPARNQGRRNQFNSTL